ncbi:MAG: HXXEE domain-containing protein [Pseudomonadota bacterium]
MKQHLALFYLLAFFAVLWIPLGQHAFLILHWMKVGTFLAPILLFQLALTTPDRDSHSGVRALATWMLVLYIIHQFEEHWVDVFGNVYAFHGSVNDLVTQALGQPAGSVKALTPLSIFVINTSLVWLVGLLAIWRFHRSVFPALAMNAIILVNAFTHKLASLAKAAYNPGLFTALVLFLPFALLVYRRLLREGVTTRAEIGLSVVWAAFAHVIMVAGMVAANVFNVIPALAYHGALIVWSIVPTLISFSKSR